MAARTGVPAAQSTQEVRLRDLLARAQHPGVRVLDDAALRSAPDIALYAAHRDVQVRPLPGEEDWRCDRVHYAAGIMAGGEPVRSIGHWNRPGQIEVFQVLAGRVVIACVLDQRPDHVFAAEYGPGDVCVVPPSAYHLTYSPWKPSVVVNIYQDVASLDADHRKYEGEPAPPVTLRRTSSGLVVDAARPVRVHRQRLCPPGLPVSRIDVILTEATDEQLRRLRARIETAYAHGWPR